MNKATASLLSVLIPVGFGMSAPATATQPPPEKMQAARAAIIQRMQERDIPSVAIAAWKDGQIVWEEGLGWADRANRIAATEHTMYMLASLSKTLTATGLMTLVQAGKVDLDKPANDYLGDDKLTSYVGNAKDVTVRTLANHTSGLPGSDQWFYGAAMADAPTISDAIRRYGILVAPAGERYRYSNLGYGVLGHLLSRVSGKSYGQFMQEAVFTPLGMTRSALDVMPGFEAHKAQRYDYAGRPIPDYASVEPASATLYSSAHDLARYGMFMLKNRLPDQRAVLTDASIDRMSRQPARESADSSYGIGLVIEDIGGHHTIGHSGSASGVSSNFVLVPEQNAGIVMLANIDGGVPTDLQYDVLKTMLPSWQEPPPASKKPVAADDAFKPNAELTGRWQGRVHTYEGDLPMTLDIEASGDVHVRIGGDPKFPSRSTVRMAALLNDVKFKDGELTGKALSQIETTDTARHPHTVSLYLKQRGQVLNGVATAVSLYDGLWIYGLPYWTELKKTSDR
ncbi:serine hydrolase domain-containing protein [Peristeroidobacter soli]|jgi:CubicO group peptidase (beta-lactamase class C family)|uniref:serine hydrolase domain-containing protein n=1 Tax=Peristeroidobacter soli TaxID=2497877 RepID=UPI00101D09CF|nr:serine hydrolase domain-containing protein [Peristeroidobacter soli]